MTASNITVDKWLLTFLQEWNFIIWIDMQFTYFNPGVQPLAKSDIGLWLEREKLAKDFPRCYCCKAFDDLISRCAYVNTHTAN